MSFARTFHSYQQGSGGIAESWGCSPSLGALRIALARRYGTISLGCHGVRKIRGGEALSSHSYGAAIDLSYLSLGVERARAELIPHLVAWSGEWGIQAIHDYYGCRVWRAGRTDFPDRDACTAWWKAQRPGNGMGEDWATYLHVEVHPRRWHDNRSEFLRGIT